MNTILVINCGSSSLKFALFSGRNRLLQGSVAVGGGDLTLRTARAEATGHLQATTIEAALGIMRTAVREAGIMPTVVAHRVVHGGGIFQRPIRVTAAVERQLRGIEPLAPLHMPANLHGLRAAKRWWPRAQQWAVFDTAAFHDLPPAAFTYALPARVAAKHHIRKYGFHGISHQWSFARAAEELDIAKRDFSAVTIHLGAGDSVTRWERGRVMDTSMGFSPLEGLTMSTRSGDLDPSIPLFLQTHGRMTPAEVMDLLNTRSGLLGVSGFSDLRDVLSAVGHRPSGWPKKRLTARQRRQARLAWDMFVYDVARYVASYLGLNMKTQAIVFTGAEGHNPFVRRSILAAVPAARRVRSVFVSADEERAIADDVQKWYNRRA